MSEVRYLKRTMISPKAGCHFFMIGAVPRYPTHDTVKTMRPFDLAAINLGRCPSKKYLLPQASLPLNDYSWQILVHEYINDKEYIRDQEFAYE